MPAEVLYDAGALIAAERNERMLWALHRAALDRGIVPLVPSTVLAQVWRGGRRQVGLSRLLRGCETVAFGEDAARATGELLAATRRRDVVDASVVVLAAGRGAEVVTSDRADLERLAEAAAVELVLHDI